MKNRSLHNTIRDGCYVLLFIPLSFTTITTLMIHNARGDVIEIIVWRLWVGLIVANSSVNTELSAAEHFDSRKTDQPLTPTSIHLIHVTIFFTGSSLILSEFCVLVLVRLCCILQARAERMEPEEVSSGTVGDDDVSQNYQ